MTSSQRWPALDGDLRWFALGYAILLPAFLAPLMAVAIVPGLDFPFHIALADMIAKSSDVASPYAGGYEPRLWPPPPALSWLSLAILGKVTSLTVALRIMLGLYVASLPLVVAACARFFGASAVPALLAFPLAYNMGVHYGFFGYVLSLPVLFALVACCAGLLRTGTRQVPWAIGVATVACVLYGTHLETYVLGVAAVVAMAALSTASNRQKLASVAALAPSLALAAVWHFSTPFSGGAERRALGPMVAEMFAVRSAELEGRSLLTEIVFRLEGLPVHLLRGFRDNAHQSASAGVFALVIFYGALSVLRPLRAPSERFARARWAMPVISLVAFVGLPHHLARYEAMSISPRLAPMFVLALLTAIPLSRDPAARPSGEWAKRLLFAVSLVFSFLYGNIVGRRYTSFSRELQDFRATLDLVPAGGKLVGVVFQQDSYVMKVESSLVGLPSLYVALRPSPTSMVALRYCGMRHVPCSLGARALPRFDPWAAEKFEPATFAGRIDYVISKGAIAEKSAMFDHAPVTLIGTRGAWSAYRMRDVGEVTR